MTTVQFRNNLLTDGWLGQAYLPTQLTLTFAQALGKGPLGDSLPGLLSRTPQSQGLPAPIPS